MRPINQAWMDMFPEEFRTRVLLDNSNKYWISCQIRSHLEKGDDAYYPYDAYVVITSYSISEDGTIIFEDLNLKG